MSILQGRVISLLKIDFFLFFLEKPKTLDPSLKKRPVENILEPDIHKSIFRQREPTGKGPEDSQSQG